MRYTALPLLFMLVSTLTAMAKKLTAFKENEQYLLLTVGVALYLDAVGIIIEGIRAYARRERHDDDAIVFDGDSSADRQS